MPPRAVFNFVYAGLVSNMERKDRDEFDATLNSGVSGASWNHMQARALERLQDGEFDQEQG